MEFWGVEVKPGETVKCDPGEEKLIHLSHAAIGETKDKGAEGVPIFVKINDQKLVLGTLSAENCAQISCDLVFEKKFELSHNSKNASFYFCGYRRFFLDDDEIDSEDDDLADFDSEEDVQIAQNGNGKPKTKEQQGKPTINAGKAAKLNAKTVEPIKSDKPTTNDEDEDDDGEESDEDDDSENDSEDDEDMAEAMGDSDDSEDEDDDESSDEEEEATPKKAVNGKKRAAESASKTPALEKKAKLVTPVGQKTGGDGKKGGHVDTPHPAKQAGKTPKSAGSVTCKSCSKSFNSENALQAHSKAKHSDSK